MAKYIVILGSIMSGLGKGIVTSSLLKILKERGLKVLPLKFDGYLNVDCGTMNPYRHGEVFVLKDGTEVDMDFGHYERFLGKDLTGESSLTGGKIFKQIIEKERRGDYLGEDVQFIPHVTNLIKDHVKRYAKGQDIVIIEVGGTVGDIENAYFIEAMRQLSLEEKVLFIQLTYLPEINNELKTKPTQHANKLIQSYGIKPSILLLRANRKPSKEHLQKIALYTNTNKLFYDPTLETIYELPLVLEDQNIYYAIADELGIKAKKEPDWKKWKKLVNNLKRAKRSVNIAIVGKYVENKDAYASVKEALVHAGAHLNTKVNISFEDSSKLGNLSQYDGLIIAGGFGKRGIEGKIKAIKYARENNIPLLGICLGMQLMVVEWARNVLGWKKAHSTEFNPKTPYPVVDILPEQKSIIEKGATMRLGEYPMEIKPGTLLSRIYRKKVAKERHRHRYEINPKYIKDLEKSGLIFSAFYKHVPEAIEYPNQLGIGLQSHPELTSKFEKPSPVFLWLVKQSMKSSKK
ncbi:MAG: CTP synthase [Candidatus Micrarchaeota archaeon]|nr:CTP synthase [Candidatus Micrarchaeota archaeon]